MAKQIKIKAESGEEFDVLLTAEDYWIPLKGSTRAPPPELHAVQGTSSGSYPTGGIKVSWVVNFLEGPAMQKLLEKYPIATWRQFVGDKHGRINGILLELLRAWRCSMLDFLRVFEPDAVRATADSFVSYSRRYPVRDTIEVLKRLDQEKFIFLDFLCINQFEISLNEPNLFRQAVRQIRRVHAIAYPFRNPEILSRAWCMLELSTCLDPEFPTELSIEIFPREEDLLRESICSNVFGIVDALSAIDIDETITKIIQSNEMRPEYHSIFKDLRGSGPEQSQKQRVLNFQDGIVRLIRGWVADRARIESERGMELGQDQQWDQTVRKIAYFLRSLGRHVEATVIWKKLLQNAEDQLKNMSLKPESDSDEAKVKFGDEKEKWMERIADLYHQLSQEYLAMGDASEALEWLNRLVDIKVKILNKDDAQYSKKKIVLAPIYNRIAEAYEFCDDFDNAQIYLSKAEHIRNGFYGKMHNRHHPIVAAARANIARIFMKKGDLQSAKQYLLEAKRYFSTLYKEDPASTIVSHSNLVAIRANAFSAQCMLGVDLPAALLGYQTVFQRRQQLSGRDSIHCAIYMNDLANCYMRQDPSNIEDAKLLYLEASETFIRHTAFIHAATVEVNLAYCFKCQNDEESAQISNAKARFLSARIKHDIQNPKELRDLWDKVEIRGNLDEVKLMTGEELVSLFNEAILHGPYAEDFLGKKQYAADDATWLTVTIYNGMYLTFGDGFVPVFSTDYVNRKILPGIKKGLASIAAKKSKRLQHFDKLRFTLPASENRKQMTLFDIFCCIFDVPSEALLLQELPEEFFESRYGIKGDSLWTITASVAYAGAAYIFLGAAAVNAAGVAFSGGAAYMANAASLFGMGSVFGGLMATAGVGAAGGIMLTRRHYSTRPGDSAWDRRQKDKAKVGAVIGGVVGGATSAAALVGAGAGPAGLAAIGGVVSGGMLMGMAVVVAGPLLLVGASAAIASSLSDRGVNRPFRSSDKWDPVVQIEKNQPEDMDHANFEKCLINSFQKAFE